MWKAKRHLVKRKDKIPSGKNIFVTYTIDNELAPRMDEKCFHQWEKER